VRLLLTTRHRTLLIATGDDVLDTEDDTAAPETTTHVEGKFDVAPAGYDETYYYEDRGRFGIRGPS
jgi:hypothetical protein